MTALNYLNEIVNNRSAFVPVNLAAPIATAANTLGIAICGGIYDPETQTRALYIA